MQISNENSKWKIREKNCRNLPPPPEIDSKIVLFDFTSGLGHNGFFHLCKEIKDAATLKKLKVEKSRTCYMVTGWIAPDEIKMKEGDELMLNTSSRTIYCDIIKATYTDHPGIFGEYDVNVTMETVKVKNDNGEEETIERKKIETFDIEPDHPNKKGTRFEAICLLKV